MKFKRRRFIFLISAVLFLNALQGYKNIAYAEEIRSEKESELIQPRYSHLQSFYLSFDINRMTGRGIAAVVVSCYDNTDYVAVRLNFQRYLNGKWTTFNSQTNSSRENIADWEFQVALTYHGYRYRAQLRIDLIEADGTCAEYAELTSNEYYYE